MVAKTTMNEQNGASKSASKGMTRSLAGLGHDAMILVELQWELFQRESQQSLRSAATPIALLAIGGSIALGCVPILLLSLAHGIVEFAGLSQAFALLISGIVGLLVAGLGTRVGVQRLRGVSQHMRSSREEFQRNVRWVKQILEHRSNPPGANCPSQSDRQRTSSQFKE